MGEEFRYEARTCLASLLSPPLLSPLSSLLSPLSSLLSSLFSLLSSLFSLLYSLFSLLSSLFSLLPSLFSLLSSLFDLRAFISSSWAAFPTSTRLTSHPSLARRNARSG